MRRFASAVFAVVALTSALPAMSARAADTYSADPVHSSVVFRIKHFDVAYVWGRFNALAGSFAIDEASPEKSNLQFSIEAKNVDTGNAKRDEHLRSADFFNAAQFPTITFKSTAVKKAGERYEVTGDFTLLGVTKPITVSVEKTGEAKTRAGQRAGFETTFSIKRSDYGMNKMLDMVGDDVRLVVSVEGVKK